ncbi:hypothetical protein BC829DRAFT_413737 [Chytridium lagenaria]|nr:hypothetical protein BC829DRAFT_413737 [Chytridium lagenaria]
MFSGPVRGGNRGGAGDFKWEDVKEDKNRDLNWYNKDGTGSSREAIDDSATTDEMRSIKEKEAEAMAEALGYGGKKKQSDSSVSKQEIKRLLQMDSADLDEDDSRAATGLGFGRRTTVIEMPVELPDSDVSDREVRQQPSTTEDSRGVSRNYVKTKEEKT